MFFSGDPSTKRKVDLGGRSSKERDRGKLLEQARIEREKRHRYRLENQSALKIQKVYRGWRVVAAERHAARSYFTTVYGEFGEKANRDALKANSAYLPQLLYFYERKNIGDLYCLAGACRLLHKLSLTSGDLLTTWGVRDSSLSLPVVEHRVKRLTFVCLQAVDNYCHSMREIVPSHPGWGSVSEILMVLLQTVTGLTDSSLPWSAKLVHYLYGRKLFCLLRNVLLAVSGQQSRIAKFILCLEKTVVLLTLCHMDNGKTMIDSGSFAIQILSVPLLFQNFPSLGEVFVSKNLWALSIWQLFSSLPDFVTWLPPSASPTFPSNVCLLGNLLEISGSALCLPECPWELAVNFATVAHYLMEGLPSVYIKKFSEASDENVSDMEEDTAVAQLLPEPTLEKQLHCAVNAEFLKHLVRVGFQEAAPSVHGTEILPPLACETTGIGEVCHFLYAIFSVLPNSGALMVLAYNTELVTQLWSYIRRCHKANHWPALKLHSRNNSENTQLAEMDSWMIPLSIFCPVYSYMLVSIDNEEFYEQQKPLCLDDLRHLVIVLKEALWQLLWVLPSKLSLVSGPSLVKQKIAIGFSSPNKIFTSNSIRQRVSKVSARLLAELQDWNNRCQFMSPQDFHAGEAMDDFFYTQLENETPRSRELLAEAPFLVPFTHRVHIYMAQLAAARQQHSSHGLYSERTRIRIRRDRIIEDAFTGLNSLPEEVLQGTIRVTFINELGAEEAGVDGGGIFKDFMENITKTAFDVQYGLFKETPDHLLYPNPASHMFHDEHLQYFEFLGKVLGKAMFEGILVDIPFATFFLSKLKRKHNYLHDLSSLDPELYRHLLFLKRYQGDLSQLGLYFVMDNNEYGEQAQDELLPGGKDMQVTNENVIRYIHLVANHHLNSQIRQQSYYFLRGFQQLIQTKWIDMFNEHELQILISGSIEGMDVDDLRLNASYGSGYTENHPVILMFWEIMKTLNSEQQQKFLKFVTGCSRGPLLGFKYLEPQFCIQRAAPEDAPDDVLDRLPTSATCMNLLKLPPYKRRETMQEKLLYAINAEAGFDLS